MPRFQPWPTWISAVIAVVAACVAVADDDAPSSSVETVADLLTLVIDADEATARECLGQLADKIQNREVSDDQRRGLSDRLRPLLAERLRAGANDVLYADVAALAATLQERDGLDAARRIVTDGKRTLTHRHRALTALLSATDPTALDLATNILGDPQAHSREWRTLVLGALGRCDSPRVAELVLQYYHRLEPELQPKAIELLTQRTAWSKILLEAIGRKQLPLHVLNANQVAKLMASRDEELRKLVTEKWGSLRTERNPLREQVIGAVRARLAHEPGDPHAGQKVFQRLCGQCHKIYGEGQDVGPDITSNGRASVEQLLSNVLDPSLVIGASYQARTVITNDGRVFTGLVVEDSPQRVILKVQGGKLETIARDDVDDLRVSQLSLMPEGLETQLQPSELLDLFAFLMLDKPPHDPSAKRIPAK